MPLLWRYLMNNFLRISFTCIIAFVAILLTMQLDDIAHFAALGAPLHYILLFTFHQIPYILPIALPLSCLIAALLLTQKLSNTHELTALRASGFGLGTIFAPLWILAAFLSLGNFWIVSEMATQSHLRTNLLKSELRAINPLFLLHNKHLMRLKGFYFETLGASRVGESASEVVFALPNQYQKRLNIMVAEQLKASSQLFTGEKVTLITGMESEQEEGFDQLLIENMQTSLTNVSDFTEMIQKKVCAIHNDYLQLPLLLARLGEQKKLLEESEFQGKNKDQLKTLSMHLNRIYSEIAKRFSIAIAVFSFTLMGTAFGINISRRKSYRSLSIVIGLTTFYLISFFVAKELDSNRWLATSLYLIPHLIIICTSLFVIKQVTKGIETCS